MKCPFCGNLKSRTIETRETKLGIKRRRLCLSPACTRRFNTLEEYDGTGENGQQYALFPTHPKVRPTRRT